MTVIQFAVALTDEKLFLKRIGLHRRFRANREVPRNVTHGRVWG